MIKKIFCSTIAKKWLVALTGIYFILFLIGHLLGNLEIYSGPSSLNQYSILLRTFPKALWIIRISLIFALIIHVYFTISLTRVNNISRKDKYFLKRSRKASLSSRTMLLSGLTVLFFVLYHLAHFTLGFINPDLFKLIDHNGHHHVYNMVILGFSNPLVSLFYIFAQLLLAMHVSHGFSSAARTLGVSDEKHFFLIKTFGKFFAISVAILYISIPLSVLFGLLTPDF